jgi:hypothetical protein
VLSLDTAGNGGFPAAETAVACIRQGRNWRIDAGGRSAAVEHSVGMLYLAVLVANPRQEIPAIDLVAGLAALSDAGNRTTMSEQPTLDHEAMRAYRRRLDQLQDEIADLESRDESEVAARCRTERDWLENELANAIKLSGRSRSFADEGERARISVGKAIRRALARVMDVDLLIGDHLHRTVRTGVRCSYWPA